MEGWGGARRHHLLPGYPNQHHGFATDLGAGGCAGTSHSTSHVGMTHTNGPAWGELLEEQTSQVGPAKPPLPCMGSCPSPEHPSLGGVAQELGHPPPLAFAVSL